MNVSALLLGCLEGFGREKEKEGGGSVTSVSLHQKRDSIRVKSGGEETEAWC